MIEACIYRGTVSHRRLRPVAHTLRYDVAAVLVDIDHIADTARTNLLLSYNRYNVFSIDDRDHGTGEGGSIQDFAWNLVRSKPGSDAITQIFMLCYPRLLGFVFNPLTSFFCLDKNGDVRLMIYEVHNTFGGRHSYVTDVTPAHAASHFQTEKVFPVSPFNRVEGHYSLKASAPLDRVSVGVSLTTAEGPTLNAYFSGRRYPLDAANLARVFFGYPLMTLKVVAAIHFEALKLWFKGLKVQS